MSVAPSIRLVAFEDRQAQFVFVAVPNERGRYLRTDRSVVLVGCTLCKAIKGEPCRNRDWHYNAGTHAWRRSSAMALSREERGGCDDLIEAVDLHAPEPTAPAFPPDTPLPEIEILIRPKILGCITLCEPRPVA